MSVCLSVYVCVKARSSIKAKQSKRGLDESAGRSFYAQYKQHTTAIKLLLTNLATSLRNTPCRNVTCPTELTATKTDVYVTSNVVSLLKVHGDEKK